ncbi:GTP cyclohydrolase I type 1 [Phage NCTB]|jgi:GTP cyclohydrolase I|nr:GTP cyclohydrolase I type 1 [Phage NCTB]
MSEQKVTDSVTPISTIIRERIQDAKGSFHANDNISEFIEPGELDLLQLELERKMQGVLETMVIDTENDHNTNETAKRVAKMYLRELYAGRYVPKPRVTEFPNAKDLDEMYTVGPVDVKSTCSHHLVPIYGKAWIGVIPGEKVIGLSKFNRITSWIMGRPHIQEEAVQILANEIEELIKPKGLAIVVKATHMCMTMRGVHAHENSSMVTTVVRGALKDSPSARQEFFNTISAQGFTYGN